jgi:hypothetical protein
MSKKKHSLDVVAEQLEARAAKPAARQNSSPDYWEFRCSGDINPQAALCKPNIVFKWGDGEGLDSDGFPAVPIPDLQLKGKGKWPDVLSTALPASWTVGHLYNQTALAVFKNFNLGSFREYPVTVSDKKGVQHKLTYLLIRNRLPQTAIDFAQSEFYLADMLGDPLGPVEITSAKDWSKQLKLAMDGKLNDCEEFSTIEFKKLIILRDQLPNVDLFKLGGLGIGVYISAELKEAIEKSGITGLDIRPNKRLFADR